MFSLLDKWLPLYRKCVDRNEELKQVHVCVFLNYPFLYAFHLIGFCYKIELIEQENHF